MGLCIDATWTVWHCRECRLVDGVIWVNAEAGMWQEEMPGPACVSTHLARRLAVNQELRWVLIDPLNDTEMHRGEWQDTIPLEAIRGLTVREIKRPKAVWFDRLFRRG